MSVRLKDLSKPRWDRDLRSADTLADDLGVLGSWVGPRTGLLKRAKGQKEDYVLRRLLAAWKETNRLRWPVHMRARSDDKGLPDFLLSWPNGETLGIEVTEAGEEDYQRWLTHKDATIGEEVREGPLEASTERTVEEITRAIGRKVEKYDRGAYRDTDQCDLLVYDNTAWGKFLDKRDLIEGLGRPNHLLGRFRQVHLVFGQTVVLDAFRESLFADVSKTYEIDYAGWIFDQLERLRRGATSELDFAHIAGELEDLGRSERRALRSHLRNLLAHLLKWRYQPERRGASWSATIDMARSEIHELLSESPSLRGDLTDSLISEYRRARRLASKETGLPLEAFPDAGPFSEEDLIDPEFLPSRET